MKIVTLLVILSVAGIPLAAAGENAIIYLRPTDALNLDPWQAEDAFSNEVAVNIFEGLVRFKKNSTGIEPCLATAWSIQEGGKRWLFTLRRGVRFHDGTSFDAQAVLHTFQSRMDAKQGSYQRLSFPFDFILSIRSTDPYHVEIILKRPYAPFLVALADSAAFIVPGSARRSAVFQPIGTGPFRFQNWSRGKTLILTRNPDYWAGAKSLERIIFKVMPDSLGRLLQIRNGSADMAAIQSGKEYEELSRRSGITILSNPSISTNYLGFNTRKPPFNRREVRAAFLHIINKGSMIKRIFQNLAVPAYSPLPAPLTRGQQSEALNSFNLKVASTLLKEAGLENGFSCTLYYREGHEGIQEIADLLTVMAKKINVTIQKVKLPFPELVRAAGRGEHDMLIMGWNSGPDPDLFLYPLFTFSPGNRNRFYYENPRLTRLLDEGKATMDSGRRERIYADALDILKQDVPWIPLFHQIDNLACNERVQGVAFTPLGHVVFRDVRKETDP
ncbi:MAG: ABC transporter substrate-binding protein [Acidobacteriota bacterium]|nr:ABC transporter substrate-binding protein [Acidobacteriota bacterium]